MSIIKLASVESTKHFYTKHQEAEALKDRSTKRATHSILNQHQDAHNKLEETLSARKGMREGSAGWHQATREIGDLQGKTKSLAETHRNLIGANSKVLPSVQKVMDVKSKVQAVTPSATTGAGDVVGKAKSFLGTPHGKGLAIGAGAVGAGMLLHRLMKPKQQQPQQGYGY